MQNVMSYLQIGRWAAAVLLTASGCSSSVSVQQPFPAPLIERLPLHMAIQYPPALTDFEYKEDGAAERDWTVKLGPANVRMFDAVFSGMFAVTQRISNLQSAATEMPGLDAVEKVARY